MAEQSEHFGVRVSQYLNRGWTYDKKKHLEYIHSVKFSKSFLSVRFGEKMFFYRIALQIFMNFLKDTKNKVLMDILMILNA
jgi:hypothetical protein